MSKNPVTRKPDPRLSTKPVIRIKEAVEHSDLVNTQHELAQVVFADDKSNREDYKAVKLSYYANGHRGMPVRILTRIAEVCGVTTDYLLGLSGDPKKGRFGG